MHRLAVSSLLTFVTACLTTGCDAPYDPHEGEEEVRIQVTGTVRWADGRPVAGATVYAETFTCLDAFGNWDCTWTTGGRDVMLASVPTDAGGTYVMSWRETCRAGGVATHPRVVVPGVPRERMWLFDVTSFPTAPVTCTTEAQQKDYSVARRVPLAGTCPDGYVMVDASYAEWADGNDDEVVCRSASDSYRDNTG